MKYFIIITLVGSSLIVLGSCSLLKGAQDPIMLEKIQRLQAEKDALLADYNIIKNEINTKGLTPELLARLMTSFSKLQDTGSAIDEAVKQAQSQGATSPLQTVLYIIGSIIGGMVGYPFARKIRLATNGINVSP